MDYRSVVTDLFTRFPKLHDEYRRNFAYMGGKLGDPYTVFGSVLRPALEHGMTSGDLATILPICAFLEDVAESARNDSGLQTLLQVEVGEWLGGVANEAVLTPWLGPETKQICGYVQGLASQRLTLQAEQEQRTLKNLIRRWLKPPAGE